MPQLIPPVDAPKTQHYGQNATAGVAPVKNGTPIQQLVYLYGNYQPAGHDAIDYGAPMRTPVRAPAGGRVDFSGDARNVPYAMAIKWGWPTHGPDNWPSGLIVAMDHGDGYGTVSAHMDETHVDNLVGQWLNQGRIVGLSGKSGRSDGPHVHFSVVEFAKVYSTGSMYGRVDPAPFMTGGVQTVGSRNNLEGFLMALTDKQQQEIYDRILGGIPAGAVRQVKKGDPAPRLADSGDIADLLQRTQAQHDVTRSYLVNTTQKQHDVTRAHVINSVSGATQAQSDVTRKFLADRIKEGAQPSDVADSVIAAIGTDLAKQVVTELSARLATKEK